MWRSYWFNWWTAFSDAAVFLLLPGMLAEEGLYRLFALTGIWLLTRRQWVALIGSSAVFAAVHFLPSSGFAETFWSAPIYHFGSMLRCTASSVLAVRPNKTNDLNTKSKSCTFRRPTRRTPRV